jgi:hypothetical protein
LSFPFHFEAHHSRAHVHAVSLLQLTRDPAAGLTNDPAGSAIRIIPWASSITLGQEMEGGKCAKSLKRQSLFDSV